MARFSFEGQWVHQTKSLAHFFEGCRSFVVPVDVVEREKWQGLFSCARSASSSLRRALPLSFAASSISPESAAPIEPRQPVPTSDRRGIEHQPDGMEGRGFVVSPSPPPP